MKTKIYLRITRNGSVRASKKPDYSPISSGTYNKKFLPTIAFAINLDIPDESFKRAEQAIADIKLEEGEIKINELKASL